VDRVLQIKVFHQFRKIVSVVVHVMPFARLGRPAMTTAIMGYDPVSLIEKEHHLCVPIVRG
jgi:hypothetical protein